MPPTAPAGVTPVREIEPDAGVGETGPSVSDVTVPSASVAETAAVPAVPWSTESDGGHVTTTGALPPVTVCAPSPSNVSVANPSHSMDGSNASEPFGSPATIVGLRRSVLSAVLVRPVPHSVPGSKPIWPITSSTVVPLRSTTASSPLNQPEPFVWSATARIDAFALACATTNDVVVRDRAGQVDRQARRRRAVEEHLDAVTAGREIDRRARVVEDLERLVVRAPSTYSEKKRSDDAAEAPDAPDERADEQGHGEDEATSHG